MGSKCIGWMHVCSLYCTLLPLLQIFAQLQKLTTPRISPFASWSRKTHSPAVQTSKFRWKFEEDSIAKLTIRIVSFHQLDEDINWSFLSIVRDRRKNCWSERTCSTNSNSVNSQSQVTGRWTEWSCHCSLYAEWLVIRKTCVVNVLRTSGTLWVSHLIVILFDHVGASRGGNKIDITLLYWRFICHSLVEMRSILVRPS